MSKKNKEKMCAKIVMFGNPSDLVVKMLYMQNALLTTQ